jgi:FtsP/CotA-like multicopper oxidase with cupredoxin domain
MTGASAVAGALLTRGARAEDPHAGHGAHGGAPSPAPPRAAPAEPAHGTSPSSPLVVPNGTILPWRLVDGVKVYHLTAQPVVREFAPGLVVDCWGYNGSTPGPVIEAVEGDRVRIYVTNELPEPTTVHWHGILLPSGMDGVAGLNSRGSSRARRSSTSSRCGSGARTCTTRTSTRWCRWGWA